MTNLIIYAYTRTMSYVQKRMEVLCPFCMLLWLTALVTTSCQQQPAALETQNAVYYWRTEWRLDSLEHQFLQQHDIRKIYCRYFDVVMADEEPMPNATITFSDQQPPGTEWVPTVYITEDCMHLSHEGLAQKIVERIVQMNETNDIGEVREIQMDCDYTARSRSVYYNFLEQLRGEARKHGLSLSATIRLHQLSMPVPPVDYGVLMLYNTGDPRRFTERNPVLDIRDVMPYVDQLSDYALPLAAAYPVYRWLRNIHGVRIEHEVAADELLRVKAVVEQKRPELRHTIVTYHLAEENINRYQHETFEAIYHH